MGWCVFTVAFGGNDLARLERVVLINQFHKALYCDGVWGNRSGRGWVDGTKHADEGHRRTIEATGTAGSTIG